MVADLSYDACCDVRCDQFGPRPLRARRRDRADRSCRLAGGSCCRSGAANSPRALSETENADRGGLRGSAKWLELLKQIAPNVTRAAVLRDAALTSGIGQFAVIQSVAPSLGVEVSPLNLRDAAEIERAVVAFARSPNGGLIVTSSALSLRHRDLIIALAARHKLPAIYYRRYYVTSGGLMSYGYDLVDQFRRATGYIDRILRGAKPA